MILKVAYQLTAWFLTFVLLANNINNVVIVTDFIINQDFIAKTLCIQKDDQKGCNGKCHLTKQLVQNNTTDSNPNAPLPSTDRTQLDVFIVALSNAPVIEGFFLASGLQNHFDYKLEHTASGFYTVDTPPPDLS